MRDRMSMKELFDDWDKQLIERAMLSISMQQADWNELPRNCKSEVIFDYISERLAHAEHNLLVFDPRRDCTYFYEYRKNDR